MATKILITSEKQFPCVADFEISINKFSLGILSISVEDYEKGKRIYHFDKQTAIKLSKILKSEISKLT
jgi:hypothetical protein